MPSRSHATSVTRRAPAGRVVLRCPNADGPTEATVARRMPAAAAIGSFDPCARVKDEPRRRSGSAASYVRSVDNRVSQDSVIVISVPRRAAIVRLLVRSRCVTVDVWGAEPPSTYWFKLPTSRATTLGGGTLCHPPRTAEDHFRVPGSAVPGLLLSYLALTSLKYSNLLVHIGPSNDPSCSHASATMDPSALLAALASSCRYTQPLLRDSPFSLQGTTSGFCVSGLLLFQGDRSRPGPPSAIAHL
ncbi:hypothetical protein PHLGIDRAFT_352371 [Phlebiopsis gigantea 11061_1 CR5-6]|uniref:Uncharacterized protein n=1 Tax=Phlebiopsis gigantea (strain 11061_1 CR5-6) TaxID=745531 RepID=A0A0C3RYW6_PHLG1|nr:hypothetical protein PHLGIDRAFT_352371 [Phlebiopsis gigantea 11061_1 CR5-6]